MGLLWVAECLHFLLHGDHAHLPDCLGYTELGLRLLGCLNLGRGSLIAAIFVWKDSTRNRVGGTACHGQAQHSRHSIDTTAGADRSTALYLL